MLEKVYPIKVVKRVYLDHWTHNSRNFDEQSCYHWMAEQLKPIAPQKILDIGCGTGEGVRTLVELFGANIISIEENLECLQEASGRLKAIGVPAVAHIRGVYTDHQDGTHDILFSQDPIKRNEQVSLIHGDAFNMDNELCTFLENQAPYDAVTVWLTGSDTYRPKCRNNFRLLSPGDFLYYRLKLQNKIYDVANVVLRPGGWLQVCDRGQHIVTEKERQAAREGHEDQASTTDLQVTHIESHEYKELSGKGVKMVTSASYEGSESLTKMAIISVISQKPI